MSLLRRYPESAQALVKGMGMHSPPLPLEEFTAIVVHNQHALQIFLNGLVRDQQIAADLLQDTFQDAWQAAKKGEPPFIAGTPAVEPRKWLFRAAYCNAMSALRRSRKIRFIPFDEVDDTNLVDSTDAAFEERIADGDALRQAMATLPPQDVACLLLRLVHQLSAAEVGHILGVAPDVVTKRLSRAKLRLRAAYTAQMALAEERA
jgi:RNA polymerase sigma-70 factor, ECF subfamily